MPDTTRALRVLLLSWEFPPLVYGGLGRHVHGLAESLARAGHDVVVVTQHAPGAAYDEVRNGVRVVRAAADPPPITRDDLLAWVLALNHPLARAALRVAEGWRPDVLHAHDWVVAHAAAGVKEALGLPLVATVHATEAGRHQGWLPGDLSKAIHTTEWWLTYEARRVITCSEHMRWEVGRLFDLSADKVQVVPNAVDPTAWRVPARRREEVRLSLVDDDAPLLVYAGRLEYEKGVHTLLAALPRLRRRHPGMRLVVAGTGTYEQELRAQVRALRLGRRVVFTGALQQPQVAATLAAADLAVVPSIYEPFGMVALEAASVGTPVLVSRTGGLREIAAALGVATFPAGDSAALADAAHAALVRDASARPAIPARRRLRTSYAWSQVAAGTTAVYVAAMGAERALQSQLRAAGRPPLRAVVRDGNLLDGATDG